MLLIAHKTFLEQYKAVVAKSPAIKKSLDKQLEKAANDPFRAGQQLRDIADENLRQKLLKLWVRGENLPRNKGHRLLYLVVKEKNYVLPFFISPNPRDEFSYDDYDWEGAAKQIYEDLMGAKLEEFAVFTPWTEQISG